jgi:hypothetical protein
MVLGTLALLACNLIGGGRAQSALSPPEITLTTGGGAPLVGELIDVCFPDGGGCTESVPPTYTASDFVPLPPTGTVDLQINGPLPTMLALNLLPYKNGVVDFGAPVDAIALSPQHAVASWHPTAPPGLYVVDVVWQLDDKLAVYWFPVVVP